VDGLAVRPAGILGSTRDQVKGSESVVSGPWPLVRKDQRRSNKREGEERGRWPEETGVRAPCKGQREECKVKKREGAGHSQPTGSVVRKDRVLGFGVRRGTGDEARPCRAWADGV
jgi:hypothetical protein